MIRYFTMDGDYSHLDHVYINNYGYDSDEEKELIKILFDEDGHCKIRFDITFPVEDVKNGAAVIQVGSIG